MKNPYLWIAGALLVGALFMMGAQIMAIGLFLGTAAWVGVAMEFDRLPRWLRRTLMWGPIRWILDFILSWGVAFLMGYTLTGIIAGVIFGILFTFWSLWMEKRFKEGKA